MISQPLTVGHENSQLYAALKQSLQEKEELRIALLEAAETIDKLVRMVEEYRECRPSRYY